MLNRHFPYRIAFIALALLTSFRVAGQNILSLPAEGGNIPIRSELYTLPDPEGELTFNEVQSEKYQALFEQVPEGKVPNFDFKGAKAYWIRFQLAPHSLRKWYLGVELPITDKIDLYRPFSVSGHEKTSSGYTLPFSAREVPNHLFIFKIDHPGEYYIRVESRARTLVPLFAIDEYAFQEFVLSDHFLQGGFYGLLLMMICFAAFLFVTSGFRRVYLFYSLFLIFNGLIQSYISGLAHMYLFPEQPEIYDILNLAGLSALTSTMHLFFGISFLGWALLKRRFVRIGFYTLLSLELGILLLSFTPKVSLAYELMSVGSFTTNLFLVTTALLLLRRHYSIANLLFAIGLTCFLGGYLFVFAVYLELMDYFSFVTHISRLSSTIEIVFFTLAVTNQLDQYRREKQVAQNELIRLTRRQSQELEDKVRERTEELQQRNEEVLTQNEELRQQQEEMAAQRDLIQEQKESLEHQNVQIMDSIRYAKSIQHALLPSTKRLAGAVPDHFAIYRPRDLVSGDFYWLFDKNPDYNFFAVVDCTGHGVPGAFMSVMANEALNYVLLLEQLTDPAEILEHFDLVITKNLFEKQGNHDDGMVVSLVRIPKNLKKERQVVVASAWQDAYIVQNGKFETLKATRRGIGSGGGHRKRNLPFENIHIDCSSETLLYFASDGVRDLSDKQGTKFGKLRFLELLEQASQLPFAEQQGFIEYALEQHQGSEKQRDDITLVGMLI